MFTVHEVRHAKDARRIGGSRVAAEVGCEGMKQGLRLFEIDTFYLPHDLVFSKRSIENEIRWWHVGGVANNRERSFGVVVEIEVYMADGLDIVFRPAGSTVLQRIHSDKDYVELEGVFIDLEVERHDPSLLGAD